MPIMSPARRATDVMSEAQTPEEETIRPDDDADEEYHGPDPEEDEKGDGSDEDQGT